MVVSNASPHPPPACRVQYRSPTPRVVVISSGSYAQGGTDWFGAEGEHDWVSVKRPGLTDQIESVVYIGVQGSAGKKGYESD